MRIDKALEPYGEWLSAQVENAEWRVSYRAAGVVAIKEGYDLEWFCNNKTDRAKMLKLNRVKPGIAEQCVSKITRWADKVNQVEEIED
jgi:hypothetical protein